MISQKCIQTAAGFVILCLVIKSATQSSQSAGERNSLEPTEELRSYCGIQLHRAVRAFCREQYIVAYKKKEPPRNFQKPSRCGGNLIEHCCKNKCSISTFVQHCPYRYIR
ncbi:CLUMA_CG015625, isoform A [Clunio marinus]|uniref:CLUMA_CG015625, isoform A n=1 Tax=Clunio marinus TaxID=568069 RepID=A0A1J1IQM1_9DIPT|nr:CLUMA_CG015625, isoform A [Clunio marinus]